MMAILRGFPPSCTISPGPRFPWLAKDKGVESYVDGEVKIKSKIIMPERYSNPVAPGVVDPELEFFTDGVDFYTIDPFVD